MARQQRRRRKPGDQLHSRLHVWSTFWGSGYRYGLRMACPWHWVNLGHKRPWFLWRKCCRFWSKKWRWNTSKSCRSFYLIVWWNKPRWAITFRNRRGIHRRRIHRGQEYHSLAWVDWSPLRLIDPGARRCERQAATQDIWKRSRDIGQWGGDQGV